MRAVYIMISQTHTKFARWVRKLGRTNYNHAAISLDAELNQLYAFARPQHNAVLLARLVHENVFRYTLGKYNYVNVVIFRLEVTDEQYEWIEQTIRKILDDHEYIYNLLSVLSYPALRGFSTYKAFSCVEFIMFVLQSLGYEVTRPLYQYKPDDLLEVLGHVVFFRGNLLDYRADSGDEYNYLSPLTFRLMRDSATVLKELLVRLPSSQHSWDWPHKLSG